MNRQRRSSDATDAGAAHRCDRPRPASVAMLLFVSLLIVVSATPAVAQGIGQVIDIDGEVEIGHGNEWRTAQVGSALSPGDTVRTRDGARLKILLHDETVLSIGPATELAVIDYVIDREASWARALFRLLHGSVSALVSEYYSAPNAGFEIETPNAVGGVRGTEFIVSYDPRRQTTEIVALSGEVIVHNLNDRYAKGVFVRAAEVTVIVANGRPSRPRRLDDSLLRERIDGFEALGRGVLDGVSASQALRSTERMAAGELPESGEKDTAPRRRRSGSAADVIGQPPGVVGRGSLGVGVEVR